MGWWWNFSARRGGVESRGNGYQELDAVQIGRVLLLLVLGGGAANLRCREIGGTGNIERV